MNMEDKLQGYNFEVLAERKKIKLEIISLKRKIKNKDSSIYYHTNEREKLVDKLKELEGELK